MSVKPAVSAALLQELHRPSLAHYPRLVSFLALYAIGAGAAIAAHAHWSAWWVYLLVAPCYLLAAASLHGVSLFTHEAVHGVLSRHQVWNRALGALCAWPVLQNCSAYRVLHLKHHHHLGAPGDPDHFKNYTPRSRLVFAMHWGRLLLGYPAYITAIPVLGFIQARTARARVAILAEVAALAALITLVILSPIPDAWLWHGWLVPMLLINTMVNIRGMSQHTLLEHETDVVRGTRTIATNPLTTWFMCNENYHLEHHLYPGVPWHNLPKLHATLRETLREQGAPIIPSYAAFVADFARASVNRRGAGTVTMRALEVAPDAPA